MASKKSALDLYGTEQGAGLTAKKEERQGQEAYDGDNFNYVPNASSAKAANKKAASPYASDNGAEDATVDPESIYLDEIQKAAHDKNYKALLQSDIAAYNMKMNAKKYLDSSLAAQGLGTQGYGTSAHIGVENSAANLYAQNLENYNEAEATALSEAQARKKEEEEKAIAEATESDNQLVTFLSYSGGSDESIASYMKKYGYTYDSAKGTWVDEDGKEASAYVQAAIQSAKENASQSVSDATDDFVNNAVKAGGNEDYIQKLVKTGQPALQKVASEISNTLKAYVSSGKAANGTVAKIPAGYKKGGATFNEDTYLVYNNGSWYVTTSTYYDVADNKFDL